MNEQKLSEILDSLIVQATKTANAIKRHDDVERWQRQIKELERMRLAAIKEILDLAK